MRTTPSSGYFFNSLNNKALFARIDGIFIFSIISCGFLCLYNVCKAYQFRYHTSFALDDRLKLIKCRALIDEAQEREQRCEDNQLQLQECSALLASVMTTNCFHNKEELLLELTQLYVTKSEDNAYQLAQQLSSYSKLLNAAQLIRKKKPDFNQTHLINLIRKAFEKFSEEKQRNGNQHIFWFIRFIEAFSDFQMGELAETVQQAIGFANGIENEQKRLTAYCNLAQCCQKINDQEKMRTCITLAQSLSFLNNLDLIKSHLTLANTFLSCKDFDNMNQELNTVDELLSKLDLEIWVESLYQLANILKKIPESNSNFKNFDIQALIEKSLLALDEKEVSIEGYFSIASIYHEFFKDSDKLEQVLNIALEKIQLLPESTAEDIFYKTKTLLRFTYFCSKDSNSLKIIVKSLESLYESYPVGNFSFDKRAIANIILLTYNKLGLKEESKTFFQIYLHSFYNEKPYDRIIRIVGASKYLNFVEHGASEQIIDQIKTAETLLPILSSPFEYEDAVATIAEGYLQIDREKALGLLKNYADKQINKYLISAAIVAIAIGVIYKYPPIGPVISFGFTAARLIV